MIDFLMVLLTLVVIAFVAYLVIHKYNTLFVFLITGVLILLIYTICTQKSIMPANARSGNIYMDVFGFVAQQFSTTMSEVGAMIMSVTGYAAYMSHLKASEKLAYYAVKPLRKLKSPYIVLSAVFILCTVLKLAITSQSALSLLLLATVFPIFAALGVNTLTAASLLTLGAMDFGPNEGSSIYMAQLAKMPVMRMFMKYQGPIVLITTIILAFVIPFYYKRVDQKAMAKGEQKQAERQEVENPNCPGWYALLPALPLVILIVWSFVPKAQPNVVAANFIGIVFVALVELIRKHKTPAKVADQMGVVFKAMGDSFTNVVSIIICASIFAAGIKDMGGITILADAISNLHGASILTAILMGLITFLAAIIMGSGSASWFAFAPLVPGIASNLSINSLGIMMPMELGSSIGRSISPVAGCTIAIAGYAHVDVVDMVKRSAPLLVLQFIIVLVATTFMLLV